ncbi:MAG TPA: hypothetical protein VF715_03925 [Thermoleophilaceae bacterium]
MARRFMSFMGTDGKVHNPDDPDFLEAKVADLEGTIRELVGAVADAQQRVAELDHGDLGWPGDTYDPRK